MQNFRNIVLDSIMGFVVADALGVPVEFKSREELKSNPVTDMREYGTYHQPRGTWSDDSTMTLATLDSIRENYGIDYRDLMARFSAWANQGDYTPYGEVFDMGIATRKAILAYGHDIEPLKCGGKGECDNGNGSLMRIIPIVLYFHGKENAFENNFSGAIQMVRDASCLTHAHIRSQLSCAIYAKILVDLIKYKKEKYIEEILVNASREVMTFFRESKEENVLAELEHFARIEDMDNLLKSDETTIRSTGYVIHSLEAALWCLGTTGTYKECVLKAVNLGDDTDTVAAIAGGLAGIYYGYDAIPSEWLDVIAKRQWIEELCEGFADSL